MLKMFLLFTLIFRMQPSVLYDFQTFLFIIDNLSFELSFLINSSIMNNYCLIIKQKSEKTSETKEYFDYCLGLSLCSFKVCMLNCDPFCRKNHNRPF